MKLKHTLLSLILALSAAGPLQASFTIDWGSDPFGTLLQSDGNSMFNNNYKAEFGAFNAGFIPTMSNITEWSDNWILGQQIDVNTGSGNGISLTNSYITGTFALNDSNVANTSGNLFAGGTQMYMWVYETDKTYGPGMEWAVITNAAWTVPAPTTNPLNAVYRSTDPGTVAVFGGVNNVSGGGDYTAANLPVAAFPDDDNPNTFEIQTHTLNASPVPEPGSAMLIGAVGMLNMLRRKRRQS
jgi:hypothetical protein